MNNLSICLKWSWESRWTINGIVGTGIRTQTSNHNHTHVQSHTRYAVRIARVIAMPQATINEFLIAHLPMYLHCSRIPNVPECSRMFPNVPSCSNKLVTSSFIWHEMLQPATPLKKHTLCGVVTHLPFPLKRFEIYLNFAWGSLDILLVKTSIKTLESFQWKYNSHSQSTERIVFGGT